MDPKIADRIDDIKELLVRWGDEDLRLREQVKRVREAKAVLVKTMMDLARELEQ